MSKASPIFIFDVDGVIVNAKRFSDHLRDDYGITTEQTTPFFTTVFNDCLIGKADLKETIAPFLSKWGWQGTVDELLHYWFTSEHVIDEMLMQEIQKFRQQGILCYIATNQEYHRTEYMKKKMDFETLFDGVYSSAFLGHKKPHREFFEKLVTLLPSNDKNHIWFFDDKLENVTGAQKFGINAHHYRNFETWKKVLSDF